MFHRSNVLAAGLTFSLFLSLRRVRGQEATCTAPAYSWADNSVGLDPCTVAQHLGNQCDSTGEFTVPVLPSGYYYSGEDPLFATPCVCNTVYYSLLSVCGLCQGGYASPWDQWDQNCTTVYTNSYPKTLPVGERVPHWAYQPLLANGTVDLAKAQLDNQPDADGPNSSGSGGSGGGGSGGKKKKSPVGAIAGGVVGGILVLALVGLAIFFILRRRKHTQIPTPQTAYSSSSASPPVYNSGAAGGGHPGHLSMLSEKVYDPNDPTTFPTPPVSPGLLVPGMPYTAAPFTSAATTPAMPTPTTSPVSDPSLMMGQVHHPGGFFAPHQQPSPDSHAAAQFATGPQHPHYHGAAIPEV